MAAHYRRCQCGVWSTLLLLIFASSSAAAPQPRHVLLLHSFEREFAPYNVIEETFRTELSRQSSEPIEFWEISLQPGRFNRRPGDELILDYLLSAFEDHQPDLIV